MRICPKGRIDYFGDYEGAYEIGDGKVTALSHEECIMRDLDDEDLVAQARRRNLLVSDGSI